METFLAQLKQVWPLVTTAPWGFATVFAAILLGGWAAGRFMFSERLKTLEARIVSRDEKIADYKSKLDGASPDEAKRRLDELETRLLALAPRRLTTEQTDRLARALHGVQGLISIAHDAAAADSKAFTGDLAVAFQRAGVRTKLPMVMGVGSHPPTGLGLRVADPQHLDANAARIASALTQAGVSFDVQKGPVKWPKPDRPERMPPIPDFEEPDVELLVTTKL